MAKAISVADESRTNTGIDNLKATPARLLEFLKDVRSEMRKVIWPSRADVQTTTSVVLVTVFIFAAYFWLVDNIIGRAIEALLHKLSTHS
jgi:preprotein translocase subunit SecE